MTDIIESIEGAFARVAAHIKNLLDNGAPHQQPLANDLKCVLDAAKSGGPVTVSPELAAYDAKLDEANTKIANLQSNVDAILAERDSLKLALDGANANVLRLEAALADTQSNGPMSIAAEPVGGRIASATIDTDTIKTQP